MSDKPYLLFEPHVLGFLTTAAQHETRTTGRTAGAGQVSLGVCMRSGRIKNRERRTRSLRTSLDDGRAVHEEVAGDLSARTWDVTLRNEFLVTSTPLLPIFGWRDMKSLVEVAECRVDVRCAGEGA